MKRHLQVLLFLWGGLAASDLRAQHALTWEEVKMKFSAANPTLQAAQLNIDEGRAAEITAYLRPNPDFSLTADGFQIARNNGVWAPLSGVVETPGLSYFTSASISASCGAIRPKENTAISESTYLDQERNLVFNLRSAFVQVLQAKAVLQNAKENLAYWDKELDVNRTRFKAGDLAQVDLNRLELQRVQFESDYETATVNLRTAKIQLLMLMNERTPIERFDVTGPFEFSAELPPLEELPQDRAGDAARSQGRDAERGTGESHARTRGCQRLDRSDLERVVLAQSVVREFLRE